MRTLRAVASLLVLVVLMAALAACGGEDDEVASDPAPSPSEAAPGPAPEPPAATGRVSSARLGLVLDRETPQLCLGPVALSIPPQCSGLPLVGWRWSEHPEHERQDGVRWGSFAVTGTWDGERFTVTDAIPAALYDVPPSEEPNDDPAWPTPSPALSADDLAALADETEVLPGRLSASPVQGRVLVDVVYDDGSLQEWADARWGPGAVVLLPLLTGDGAS